MGENRVIQISITNKIANAPPDAVIVCGNNDYVISFSFDSDWTGNSIKTARFVFVSDGETKKIDVPFSGDTVAVPILFNTQRVTVGVFSDNLQTTTGAKISCIPSIRCGTGETATPEPDVYDQIMALIDKIGAHTHDAADISYEGETEYISATNVESALKVTSAAILDLYGQIDGAAEIISEIKTTLGVE